MTQGDGRQVSRRGLFGAFRRGARSLRDGLDDVHRAHRGNARTAGEAPRYPVGPSDDGAAEEAAYDRLLRPARELAFAVQSGPASWTVDLGERRLQPGDDSVVRGGGLMEPLVLVRVNAHHWAACTGECPVDGSDIRWRHDEDLLRCPSCASAWRLDGECLQAPADSPLARFVVDAYDDDEGRAEVRIHRP